MLNCHVAWYRSDRIKGEIIFHKVWDHNNYFHPNYKHIILSDMNYLFQPFYLIITWPYLKYITITVGYHTINDFERMFLTMGMGLTKSSQLSSRTVALNPLLQTSRILKPTVYLKEYIKSLPICWEQRIFRNMTLMIWILVVSYWLQ